MTIARLSRPPQRQLGQFLTPPAVAAAIVRRLRPRPEQRVLEPSFGEGAFLFALADAMRQRLPPDRVAAWAGTQLHGCELDPDAHARFAARWSQAGLGPVPQGLVRDDFFAWLPPGCDPAAATDRTRYFAAPLASFDLIVGNPPFGGSIAPALQDELDALFGQRGGRKIKKETYAFFLVKCVDLLRPGGRLAVICSDTLLTIATMAGLRAWLQEQGSVDVAPLPAAFPGTRQRLVLLTLTRRPRGARRVRVSGTVLAPAAIAATPNLSWGITPALARYFTGASVGDKLVASAGMTLGRNELFLRRIEDGAIEEPYAFALTTRPVTLAGELARARLGRLPLARVRDLKEREARGEQEPIVTWQPLATPLRLRLPHPDYRYYNKATSQVVYSPPAWVIFWRGEGEYVYRFKQGGNWYLRGVGGRPYFGREGLTWALIAPRLYPRYLPPGQILDTGAPCAFLRPGVPADELYFVLGWALTPLCSRILKEVLNHTRNIQSKDFERLPYPVWVDTPRRRAAVRAVRRLIALARGGQRFAADSPEVQALEPLYAWLPA